MADVYVAAPEHIAAAERFRQARRRDVGQRLALALPTFGASLIQNPHAVLARNKAMEEFQLRQGVVGEIGQNEQHYYDQEQAARIEQHRQIQANIFKQMDAFGAQRDADLQASIRRSLNNIATEHALFEHAVNEANRPKTLDPQVYAYLQEQARGGDPSAVARLSRMTDSEAVGLARGMVRKAGGVPDEVNPLTMKAEPTPEYDRALAEIIESQRAIGNMTGGEAPAAAGDTPESVARLAQLVLRGDVYVRPGDAYAQFLGAINGDGNTALSLLAEQYPTLAASLQQDAQDGLQEQTRLLQKAQTHLDNADREGSAVGAKDPQLAGLAQQLREANNELRQSLTAGSAASTLPGKPDGEGLLKGPDGQDVLWENLTPEQQQQARAEGYQSAFGVVAKPRGTQGEELMRSLDLMERLPTYTPVRTMKEQLMAGPVQQYMKERSLPDPDEAFRMFMRDARLAGAAKAKVAREIDERGLKSGAISRRKEVLNATRAAYGLPVPTSTSLLSRKRPAPAEVTDEEANRLIPDFKSG